MKEESNTEPNREKRMFKNQIAEAVERGKREILADIEAGVLPASVLSMSELHEHVDANEYGGLCEDQFFDARGHVDMEAVVTVQARLNEWLKSGRVSS